jgi:outer membrane translocation and assembly module TamA
MGDIRVNSHATKDPSQLGPCQLCQIGRVGASVIVDRRDDPLNPTRGAFTTTTLQVANAIFGSELNFATLFNQSSLYFPLRGGALATSYRFGWNYAYGRTAELAPGQTQQLPATERYFAGGSTTLRGFGLDEARPSSKRGLEGGNVMTIGNIEYRFPIRAPIPGVGAALFYDTGNVFPYISTIRFNEFTHTAGFGLRYQTPVGPARLDFGFNLKPALLPDGTPESRLKIFFTLGNPF